MVIKIITKEPGQGVIFKNGKNQENIIYKAQFDWRISSVADIKISLRYLQYIGYIMKRRVLF